MRWVVALLVLWPSLAFAELTVSLPLEDTTIMGAHRHNNDGGWGYLWVKIGNGSNRILFRADLSPLAGLTSDDILASDIRVRVVWDNALDGDASFAVHADDPRAPAGLGWVEGSGRFDHMVGYCGMSEWARPSRKGTGRGATWNCADDPNIADGGSAGCALPWIGGFPGFLALPSVVVTPIAEAECLSLLSFPVTVDPERPSAAWLIRRAEEGLGTPGAFRALSREGAVCVAGEPAYAPRLVVTLRDGVTVGPIAELLDPCDAAGF